MNMKDLYIETIQDLHTNEQKEKIDVSSQPN